MSAETDVRYLNAEGNVVTRTTIENDFRKARIVAGQPTSGDDYNAALTEWIATYEVLTPKEQKKRSAPVLTFMWLMGITAVIAVLAGTVNIMAFFVVAVAGFVISFGIAGFVALLTVSTK